MTIAEIVGQGKELFQKVPRDVLVVFILVFATSGAFGLGVLAGRDSTGESEFSIKEIPLVPSSLPGAALVAASPDETGPVTLAPASLPAGGQVVASKNGTKYHLPWCSGAKQIKDENKIWFASLEEAEKAGYSPAANCKGL